MSSRRHTTSLPKPFSLSSASIRPDVWGRPAATPSPGPESHWSLCPSRVPAPRPGQAFQLQSPLWTVLHSRLPRAVLFLVVPCQLIPRHPTEAFLDSSIRTIPPHLPVCPDVSFSLFHLRVTSLSLLQRHRDTTSVHRSVLLPVRWHPTKCTRVNSRWGLPVQFADLPPTPPPPPPGIAPGTKSGLST